MSVKKKEYSEFSIGIVGAGPAGTLSAYLLARQGFKVRLLERTAEVKRRVCGEYLCPSGVDLLSRLNILEQTCRGFLKLNGMILVSPDQLTVETDFPNLKTGLSLNRKLFDERLLQMAGDAGAEIVCDWTLNSVVQNNDGKWEIRNVRGESLTFDLLIVADGRQSKIGHSLGHIQELNTKRAALHCYLPRKKHFGRRKGEMHIFDDGSYCGLDPVNDGEVNFSIVIDSEKLKRHKPEELIAKYIETSERLKEQFEWTDQQEIEIKKVTCLKNKNDFIAGSNLAYIGDAAGFIDPLTGEGIFNALLSANLLAEAIATEDTVTQALQKYKAQKKKKRLNKELLNHFFQQLIKHPFLVKLVALFLMKKKSRGDVFIGIIGNIYEPLEGLIRLIKA